MRYLGLILLFLLVATVASAQTLEWDPPTQLQDGSPIPTGEVVKYRVYAGATEVTLTERVANLTVPSVPVADLNLTATDKWLAVEGYSDQRVGARSVAVQHPPYALTFQLKIIQTLGP